MLVSVDPLADEIVCGGVAQVDDETGDRLVEVDEPVWEGRTGGRRRRRGTRPHQDNSKQGQEHPVHGATSCGEG